MQLDIVTKWKCCMQCCFDYFLKHPGITSSMVTYVHISNMLTDKSRLTSFLMSFCRINCVCRRFREVEKMECFFLSVRSFISYTYAWPVFCWTVSSKHDLFPCICSYFLSHLAQLYPLLSCLQHTYKSLLKRKLEKCVLIRSYQNSGLMITHLRWFLFSSL